MASTNLVLRFLLELIGIAAVGYAAFQASDSTILRVIAAVAAPVVLIGAWALIVAPNADNALSQPVRDLVGTGLLLLVAGALGLAGQPTAAAWFAGVVLVNTALLVVFGQDARAALGGTAR